MQAVHGLLTPSEGNSLITETVFENSTGHAELLNRLADIQSALKTMRDRPGAPILSGAPVVN